MWFYWVIGVIVLIILSSLKVVKEYERGVRFLLGKFSGVMKPGLRMILPVIHSCKELTSESKQLMCLIRNALQRTT